MKLRPVLLPLVALVAAVTLIGVQLAAGGGDYTPARAADPCRAALPAWPADGLDPLAQQLVLLGVQRAACTLGVSRERLILALPSPRDRLALARESGRGERGLVLALAAGLNDAVGRMDRAGRLPRASSLRDSYAGQLGLPGIAEAAVRQIPDRVVDGLLPTGAVLRRALARLDLERVLGELGDPNALETRLRAAIRDAALAEARARLVAQLPGPLRGLLGLG